MKLNCRVVEKSSFQVVLKLTVVVNVEQKSDLRENASRWSWILHDDEQ